MRTSPRQRSDRESLATVWCTAVDGTVDGDYKNFFVTLKHQFKIKRILRTGLALFHRQLPEEAGSTL